MARFLLAAMTLAFVVLVAPAIHRRGGLLLTEPTGRAEVWDPVIGGAGAVDGIACRNGIYYLCNEGAGRIEMWRPGEGLTTLCDPSCGIQSPEDLMIAPDGSIFFTDDDAGGLWSIAPDRTMKLLAGKDQGLVSTEGIVMAPDGSLLVGDGRLHRIYHVTRDGAVSLALEGAVSKPESMAFDEQGDLYIADNVAQKVYRLDQRQQLHVLLSAKDGLVSPESLAYSRGALYLTDPQAGKIHRYTPATGLQTVAVLAGKLKNVQGIAVDEQGTIWVTIQDLKRRTGMILRIHAG